MPAAIAAIEQDMVGQALSKAHTARMGERQAARLRARP